MDKALRTIVIVGGGAAGWLTAGLLAAEHNADQGKLLAEPLLQISVLESPDVPIIGVGEGSWPSLRLTLQKIGLSETDFLRCCEASFKQGSCFHGWRTDVGAGLAVGSHNSYLHPFSLPEGWQELELCRYWQPFRHEVAYADAVCQQFRLCQLQLAPKQISTAEYSFINNYGYHLNAHKFSELLQQHITTKLGVTYLRDHVAQIHQRLDGEIDRLTTAAHGDISADLFIDCSGSRSLLLGQQLAVPFVSVGQQLFNDSALAVQMPYPAPDSAIASCTLSTAKPAGWIWDIALASRRGVGHVYSSAHQTDEQAARQLEQYLTAEFGAAAAGQAQLRQLRFNPGYYQRCWQGNCVAVGMAAGFIEPLEASALALIEWSAKFIASQLPARHSQMAATANRMNQRFRQHWQQIISFLKLHYVLSEKTEHPYWLDHRASSSVPAELTEQLAYWRYQPPTAADFGYSDALFPAASYLYVLLGMGFHTEYRADKPSAQRRAQQLFAQNQQKCQQLVAALDGNRQLLEKVARYGFSKI
jgi:2-polyprenyl-6-methoxyphenol hydroxylase-like FAD-dependent oxidoreductase